MRWYVAAIPSIEIHPVYDGLELGILVWQDFQFACGVYPAHPEFVENVRKEAIYNVDRLKHHPCMAVFCGNNEGQGIITYYPSCIHKTTPQTINRCYNGEVRDRL